MKRRNVGMLALALVVTLILSTTVFAQGKMSAGLKGGVNLSMTTGDKLSGSFDDLEWLDVGFEVDIDGEPYDIGTLNSIGISELGSRTLYMFGGYVNYKINDNFSLQPEVFYVRKGAVQDLTASTTILGLLPVDFSGVVTWKLDYLEIPVLAKIMLKTDGKIKPALLVGPAFAFKISSNVGISFLELDQDFDIGSFTKSFDFGLVAGACADIDLNPTTFISVEGRYDFGLMDWTDEPLIDLVSVKNSGLQFMAGVGFRFGE